VISVSTIFSLLMLGTAAHAAQSIQVGEVMGDFDGDGRRDSAVLLQDNRVWQIVVNCANGKKVLVDQVSAPDLTLPMQLTSESHAELGMLPVLALGPVGSQPVWFYQWNGHTFSDVSDQVRALSHH
jgi:hypothetical protein